VGARESESYHGQSADLADAWRARGAAPAVVTVPAADHFSILNHLADPDGVLFGEVMRLLAVRG
jgi:hypothetical protein